MNKVMRNLTVFLVLAAVLCGVAYVTMICVVDTGNTGLLIRFGEVLDTTYEAGFHFKSPFVSVVQISNKEQMRALDMLAFSKDVQEVSLQLNVNYRLQRDESARMYREVGPDYEPIVMMPRVLEITKNVISEYTAEQIVSEREEISRAIRTRLAAEMTGYGLLVSQVSLSDVDFADAYTNAVEAKQVASQTKLQSAIEQERMLAEAQNQQAKEKLAADTEAYRLRQEADARAYATETEASATAQANKMIAESLTAQLIEYHKLEKWNGSVPQVQMGSEGSLSPIIDMR